MGSIAFLNSNYSSLAEFYPFVFYSYPFCSKKYFNSIHYYIIVNFQLIFYICKSSANKQYLCKLFYLADNTCKAFETLP